LDRCLHSAGSHWIRSSPRGCRGSPCGWRVLMRDDRTDPIATDSVVGSLLPISLACGPLRRQAGATSIEQTFERSRPSSRVEVPSTTPRGGRYPAPLASALGEAPSGWIASSRLGSARPTDGSRSRPPPAARRASEGAAAAEGVAAAGNKSRIGSRHRNCSWKFCCNFNGNSTRSFRISGWRVESTRSPSASPPARDPLPGPEGRQQHRPRSAAGVGDWRVPHEQGWTSRCPHRCRSAAVDSAVPFSELAFSRLETAGQRPGQPLSSACGTGAGMQRLPLLDERDGGGPPLSPRFVLRAPPASYNDPGAHHIVDLVSTLRIQDSSLEMRAQLLLLPRASP
jgi:hypothetical protein